MTKRIYSKPASKEYMDNFESIFGKEEEVETEEEEEKETELERAKRLEDFGDRLFEKKPQTNGEAMEVLRNLSKDHITPSNKAEYKPDHPKSEGLLGGLWDMFTTSLGRWYRKGR
jgi:hypothetical protein